MSVNPGVAGDLVKEITSATTTGPIVLPDVVVPGFQRFSDWFADGNRVNSYAVNDGAGNYEFGKGVYTAASHHISRDYLWWSSNGGAIVDFTGISASVYSAANSGDGALVQQTHQLAGGGAPTTDYDITIGYDHGSFVFLPAFLGGAIYVCRDPSTGAADWTRLLDSLNGIEQPKTVTAGGTTGAQTIDKPTGSVNFAIGATTLVVTNATVLASSLVFAQVMTNDATMKSVQAVITSVGHITLYANAAATAETKVAFWVIN